MGALIQAMTDHQLLAEGGGEAIAAGAEDYGVNLVLIDVDSN
jgi:hypothetical protein